MSLPGRPATPEHLKLITGNPGRRPLNPRAPGRAANTSGSAQDPAVPDCPSHLGPYAREEWDRALPGLVAAGLMSDHYRTTFAVYCFHYGEWRRRQEQLAALDKTADNKDATIRKAHNGFEQLSQLFIVSKYHQAELLKCAAEFGMSPATFARVEALSKQGSLFPEDDPIENLLSAGRSTVSAA